MVFFQSAGGLGKIDDLDVGEKSNQVSIPCSPLVARHGERR